MAHCGFNQTFWIVWPRLMAFFPSLGSYGHFRATTSFVGLNEFIVTVRRRLWGALSDGFSWNRPIIITYFCRSDR